MITMLTDGDWKIVDEGIEDDVAWNCEDPQPNIFISTVTGNGHHLYVAQVGGLDQEEQKSNAAVFRATKQMYNLLFDMLVDYNRRKLDIESRMEDVLVILEQIARDLE